MLYGTIIAISLALLNGYTNAYPTRATLWPWIASLQTDGEHVCSATLIRSEEPAILLTAAHCVTGITSKGMKSTEAVFNLDEYDWGEDLTEHYAIDEISIHGEYTQNSHKHDIALIKLKEKVTGRQPVELSREETCCDFDDKVRIIGYKFDSSQGKNGAYTDSLEWVDTRYVPVDECAAFFAESEGMADVIDTQNKNKKGSLSYDMDGFLCGYDKKKVEEACQSDTGGPVLNGKRNNMSPQVGIVSFGFGCEEGAHGAFLDLALYADWIDSAMACLTGENKHLCNGKISMEKMQVYANARLNAMDKGLAKVTAGNQNKLGFWMVVGAVIFAVTVFLAIFFYARYRSKQEAAKRVPSEYDSLLAGSARA